jgi:hypothetical protein
MPGIAAIATGLLVVASFAVGVRLVVLHRRTGGAPELLLGGMLLLTVGIGYPLMIAGARAPADVAIPCTVAGVFVIAVGFSLLFAFTSRVFRPGAGWARVLTGLGVFALCTWALRTSLRAMSEGAAVFAHPSLPEVVLQLAPMNVVYTWTAWESLRYYGLMRRRVKLGLADAVVCNRFLLWGLMAIAADIGIFVSGVASARQLSPLSDPVILVFSSLTGFAQTASMLLTFLPPKSFVGWIRTRSAAQG